MLLVQCSADFRGDKGLGTTLDSVFFGKTFANPIMLLAIALLQLNFFNTCIMGNKNENESENKVLLRMCKKKIYRSIFENVLTHFLILGTSYIYL